MKKCTFFLFLSLIFSVTLLSQGPPENALDFFLPDFSDQQISVRDFALSPDGQEVYFSVESTKKNISFIVLSKKTKTGWTPVEVVSFSGQYRDIEPSFSPDGKALYFASNRPLDNLTAAPKDYDIWKVERKKNSSKWSAPINMAAPVNSEKDEFFPSVTNAKNLYFTATLETTKGREDIYVCEYTNGKYETPKPLSDSINTKAYEFNAWVAPDESVIIFSSFGRADGNGGGDLYFSIKNKSGEWTSAKHFGSPINSDKLDYCPFFDVKNKLLYFTSERTAVRKHYSKKLSFDEFNAEITQTENGLGRIYRIPFNFKG
jgi:dipeptidyl aminopeptidase/acylaminoacyl peptidase